MFRGGTIESARDQIRTEIGYLSKEAVSFYYRPVILGGGGMSFRNFNGTRRMKINTKRRRPVTGTRLWESETAVYSVTAAAEDSVVIEATGDEVGTDGQNIMRVRGIVKTDSFYMVDVN